MSLMLKSLPQSMDRGVLFLTSLLAVGACSEVEYTDHTYEKPAFDALNGLIGKTSGNGLSQFVETSFIDCASGSSLSVSADWDEGEAQLDAFYEFEAKAQTMTAERSLASLKRTATSSGLDVELIEPSGELLLECNDMYPLLEKVRTEATQ